ncbi:MAG TPA: putative beta-lysine N-acetyltransferase, partial [Desulfurivibrionaceae bacterium]|nr:putative beta-lysine N-acetyltransferase [Desulfurivibrionaceae bacterium]
MADRIITIGNSTIQHGRENDRIYLIKLAHQDMPELLAKIDHLASAKGYGKVFAKVPARWLSRFFEAGYTSEAMVPFFFGGREDCHFMCRYYDHHRGFDPSQPEITRVIALARETKPKTRPRVPKEYTIRRCRPEDSLEMAELFGNVFESYPFPVEDPEYIDQTMENDVIYFGAANQNDQLVSLASAELDPAAKNVEMTDFATVLSHRRQGLARNLLKVMDEKMREKKIAVAYTIARAKS